MSLPLNLSLAALVACVACACNDTPPKLNAATTSSHTETTSSVHTLIQAYLAERNPHVAENLWADICGATKLPKVWHDHEHAAMQNVDGSLLLVVPSENGKKVFVAADLSRAWING